MKLATAFVIAASVITSYAGPLDWLKPDALSSEKLERMKQDLGLTEEQASKIQALVSENKSKSAPLEETLRSGQTTLDALVRKPATTADEASSALSKLLETEAAMKQNQLRTVFAIRDVLTPEQQRKISAGPSSNSMAGTPLADKAARAKAAVDALGVPPTEALRERGAAVEALVQEGKLKEAEAALDKLILESGVDEPDDKAEPDFTSVDPGDTQESVLKERLDQVTKDAQRVVHLPTIRKLLKAKEALDNAIARQDAVAAGRVLSWAEQQMKKE